MNGYKSLEIETIEEGHHWHVKYAGTLLLHTLHAYDKLKGACKLFEKNIEAARQALNSKTLELTNEAVDNVKYGWLKSRKTKAGSGELADAYIIADAVRGKRVYEILNTEYPQSNRRKYKFYSRQKVGRALSVNKDGDLERIQGLYTNYPNAFEGVSIEKVLEWFYGRRKK